ncbi:reversion-inducing cysteine-rich protein with Kazal motifs-like [Diadema setosum]|uniref:reversion-inducing cysteine-rich protein with Kazal motifs-like n=1 Tax=Diadema setosum TaxID=31175 RepID=UPI003B3AF9F1
MIVIITLLLLPGALSQDPECCHRVRTHPACQQTCDQMVLESTAAGQRQHMSSLRNDCPTTLNSFWRCVNASAPEIWQSGAVWPGQWCCKKASSRYCRVQCMQANSFSEVAAVCSHTEEENLFSCLERYERRETCCNQAVDGSRCRRTCEDVFDSTVPVRNLVLDVEVHCPDQRIQRCVRNYTNIMVTQHNPRDSLHCCQRSTGLRCREVCHRTLTNLTSEGAIIEALIQGCNEPSPNDAMWQCFLLQSALIERPSHPVVGPSYPGALDGANLQCCLRAMSATCRDICVKLFTTSWANKDSWNEFDKHCQYQPVEEALLTCLADVEEPCRPGCSGLNYCAHFNNRPTDLFRSCSARSDQGAANDMLMWSEGVIRMPFMDIPVLDIAECESDMWKTIACTLQVRPCHRKTHTNMICKSDCIHILSKCIDQSRLAKGVDPVGLCNILSPYDENSPCVSLDPFLDPGKHHASGLDITTPCGADPCSNDTAVANGMCKVDREMCGRGELCQRHRCSSGCRLGEASSFLVPTGSYVQLPISGDRLDCYQACVCGSGGQLEHCEPLQCERNEMCLISGQRKEHGSHFHIDCNLCVCFGGTEICSKRQCLTSEMTLDERRRYTGLPCDCTDQYVPVCAANGKTYPSACIAKCVGNFNDDQLEIGTCAIRSPCQQNPCRLGYRCVPRRRVCLSVNFAECPQYDCIITGHNCESVPYAPVCDTDHHTHVNLCTLHNNGAELAYRGRCQTECHLTVRRTVCGHNGETYSSECEAWSDRTTVDYYGPCRAVGILSVGDEDIAMQCATVECPELTSPESCIAVTPPGACCPVCAGQLRVLFSEQEVDRVVTAAGSRGVSLDAVLQGLRDLVSVAECDLFGYLSIEGDIVVLVKPIVTDPTVIQIKACNTEAEKIEALINNRSPVTSSYLHLSPLLGAATRNPEIIESNAAPSICRLSSICCLLVWLRLLCQLMEAAFNR